VGFKEETRLRKKDKRDELIARILDAAACIKKREEQLRRTTLVLRTRLQNALRLTVRFSKIYC